MFVSETLGDKFICPYCSTPEEKVKFYNLGKEGHPMCPKCGKAHNPLEQLRLKSYYNENEEEAITEGEEDLESADTEVLEDTSELAGEEVLPDEAEIPKSDA